MEALNDAISAVNLVANSSKTGLMDLPTELHLKIIEYGVLDPPRIPKPDPSPNGRQRPAEPETRKLLGGSLRDLALVSRYFRALTASYRLETICINDVSRATIEDRLLDTYRELATVGRFNSLHYNKKFIVSLGRTPCRHKTQAGPDFVKLLNYMRWMTTMRFVFESARAEYTLLDQVHQEMAKMKQNGFNLNVFKPRQLELSCPWGSHNWNFQFLTWPYLNVERLWLDFNSQHLLPKTLNLSELRNLQYVMCRNHPMSFFMSGIQRDNMKDWTAEDSDGSPTLRQLAQTLPQVKHFAMCGVIQVPVTEIASLLQPMQSLERLDITDQQAITDDDIFRVDEMLHPMHNVDWAMKHSKLLREHENNVDRSEAATAFFKAIPSLQRIHFVRDQVGTTYHAVRDSETGDVQAAKEGETVRENWRYLRYTNYGNQAVWRCGFPNILNYELFDRLQGCAMLRSSEAFWLDPEYLSGNESIVPHHLRFDVAERSVFGVMSSEEQDRICRLQARFEGQKYGRNSDRRRRRGRKGKKNPA